MRKREEQEQENDERDGSGKRNKELQRFSGFYSQRVETRGRIFTAFNVISSPIILLGAVLVIIRLAKGLGSVTNLSQEFPWGIWIGFDVMVGVAFAGGAYVLTFVVYILRSEKYHPIVRATVLNGSWPTSFTPARSCWTSVAGGTSSTPSGEEIRGEFGAFPCLLALPALHDFPVY